jgi:hypothetical protein
MASLLLFTRIGCCLCEGLEEKLRQLDPAPELLLRDVDADPGLRARYDLQVPVLAVASGDHRSWRELPRVPPRLAGRQLADWLRRQGVP